MEWFGWSFFHFTSPAGKVVLTNPFAANPDSPIKVEDATQADLIVTADGHGDEVGSTVAIAQNTGAQVLAPGGVNRWLIDPGIPQSQIVRPVLAEQALWARMYKPDAVILHMGADHEPMDFAMQVKLLQTDNPNLKMVIPHHNRVNPPAGQTTAAQVQAAMDALGVGLQVMQPNLSQVYSFTK
jgi:L-ascorbate metabolism protein UlaG (beta-lactamase superfamily)